MYDSAPKEKTGDITAVTLWAIDQGYEKLFSSCLNTKQCTLDLQVVLMKAIELGQLSFVIKLAPQYAPEELGGTILYPAKVTPISHAIQHGQVLVLNYLLSLCANSNLDINGLLLLACRLGKLNVVEYLHRRGADLNATKVSLKGSTKLMIIPLIEAVKSRHETVVKYLLDNNAQVEHPLIEKGETALIQAIRNRDVKITTILICAGANLKDASGNCAIQLAVKKNSFMAKLLINLGQTLQKNRRSIHIL